MNEVQRDERSEGEQSPQAVSRPRYDPVKVAYLMTDRYPRAGTSVVRRGVQSRPGPWQFMYATRATPCWGCSQRIEKGAKLAMRRVEHTGLRTRTRVEPKFHPGCRRSRRVSLDALAAGDAGRVIGAIAWKVLAAIARQTRETGQPAATWRSQRAAALCAGVHPQSLRRALDDLEQRGWISLTRGEGRSLVVAVLDTRVVSDSVGTVAHGAAA